MIIFMITKKTKSIVIQEQTYDKIRGIIALWNHIITTR